MTEQSPQAIELDADTARLLAKLTANPFLDPAMTFPQMRNAFEAFYADMYRDYRAQVEREDRTIAGSQGPIPIRIYTPRDTGERDLPVAVFFHGGGSIMGSLESFDAVCQELCRQSGCLFVAVDYRLAPEHAFAAAVTDCFDAVCWVHQNAASFRGDPQRLAVAGESGGGGLAAIVTQLARAAGRPRIAFQLLIYPFVGTRGNSRSLQQFAKGYFFEAETLEWLLNLNFKTERERNDWRAAPIRASSFAGLPPAFVVTAGADILRDDAEAYAALLTAADVHCEVSRYTNTIHGFVAMAGEIQAGRDAIAECSRKLRAALRP